jgi:hypothetical protein
MKNQQLPVIIILMLFILRVNNQVYAQKSVKQAEAMMAKTTTAD